MIDGEAVEPLSGKLSVRGWAVGRGGIASVAILLDGQPAGAAHLGIARQDVAAVMHDWPDALHSGFVFNCPPRLLAEGPRRVAVRVTGRDGTVLETGFACTMRAATEGGTGTGLRRGISRAERDVWVRVLDRMAHRPRFRILLPVQGPGQLEDVAATLLAMRRQAYPSWEALLLAADPTIPARLAASPFGTESVRVIGPAELEAAPDPEALHLMLAPGDDPGEDALVEMALASGTHRGADFFTCDEIRPAPGGNAPELFRKPGFSPELLLRTNYIGRAWCARGSLLARAGVTFGTLRERGEYEAVLRCAEAARSVWHVPLVLNRRGRAAEAAASEQAALRDALARRGIPAQVLPGQIVRSYRLARTQPVAGVVSVLIPTCAAQGHIRTCIDRLRSTTHAGRIEIVCIENIHEADTAWRAWLRDNADTLIAAEGPFNWSRFSNRCAAEARGEFLLFLNDDVEAVSSGWLDAMLDAFVSPGVGVVGPTLVYPDGGLQHGGMFLAEKGIARHAFRYADPDDPGYCGLAAVTRDVSAVTGACMLVRRGVFEALGGFDEAHDIVNNDLDFCLRAGAAGHRVVYTPEARLIHHEMASRRGLPDRYDLSRFEARWRTQFLRGDPFGNPNLARDVDDVIPDEEPARLVCAPRPVFGRDEIARILVCKLDHIGDFVIAIPALRRLRALFPNARITLLAGETVRGLAMATGLLDAFIAFGFFHPRSGLGRTALDEADFAVLARRLAPERFDLAVDFRKQPDTREVLRRAGARLLAGYDQGGRFGWLDVGLEWEGDQGPHAKRSHASADLLNLVEAIATASAPLDAADPPRPQPLDFLPPLLGAAFEGRVVCVHPGVGNATRQWPASHFADLIDLLVADHAIRVVLVGTEEEQPLAAEIVSRVSCPGAVYSAVGLVALDQLPTLIGASALFVGNNSGPQHIAAALGVPTVGIYSGVIDAAEWAPVGPLAVAIRREMACSPCYLERREDCHRGLACLTGLQPAAVLAVCARLLASPAPPGTTK